MRKRVLVLTALLLMISCFCFAEEASPMRAMMEVYDYGLLCEDIQTLAGRFPEALTVEKLGQSVEDRPIYALTLGHGDVYVLVMAGVHANEIANPAMAMQAICDVLQCSEQGDEDMRELLGGYTLVVTPCVNPDGYEKCVGLRKRGVAAKTKGNANKVNLNRNFPSPYWGSKRTVGNYDYPGPSAGSEPETQAMVPLMERWPYQAALDMHSQGRLVYYGKGGFLQEDVQSPLPVAALDARGETLARAICPRKYHVEWQSPESKKTKYGSTTDYLFALGVPGITIETMSKGEMTVGRIKAEYERLDVPQLWLKLCRQAGAFAQEDAAQTQ